jgi:hypothetical protein
MHDSETTRRALEVMSVSTLSDCESSGSPEIMAVHSQTAVISQEQNVRHVRNWCYGPVQKESEK